MRPTPVADSASIRATLAGRGHRVLVLQAVARPDLAQRQSLRQVTHPAAPQWTPHTSAACLVSESTGRSAPERHRPGQSGRRFSLNAATPSARSGRTPSRATRRPRSRARRRGRCRARAAAPAWRCARRRASWRRSSRRARAPPRGRCPPATRRSTSPRRCASSTSTRRPVKIEVGGARRPDPPGQQLGAAPPGITPTVTSGRPSTAVSSHDDEVAGQRELAARRRARSRARPRSSAPAGRARRVKAARKCGRWASRSASLKALRSLRSAPTQNAFAELDESTTARTSSSAATSCVAAASSRAIAVDRALCASGRSSTISTTCPRSPCRRTEMHDRSRR